MSKINRFIAAIVLGVGIISAGLSFPVFAETAFSETLSDDPEALASVYEAFETDLPYDENELLVELKASGTAPAVVDEIEEQDSVRSSELLDDNVVLVNVENGCTIQDAIRELAENDQVACIEPNYEFYLCDAADGNPLELQTGDPLESYQLEALHVKGLWNRVAEQASYVPTLAIIDSGCLMNHEDLKDSLDQELSVDVTGSDDKLNYPQIRTLTVQDPHLSGHGTKVASAASATAGNGVGIAGAASAGTNDKVHTVMIKAMSENGSFYLDDMLKALQYVMDIHADVLNTSIGGSVDSEIFHNKIKEVYDSGVIIVCSGGNRPDPGHEQSEPNYPSDYEECIAVTSVTRDLIPAAVISGYKYSDQKDFCAPGDNLILASRDSTSAYVNDSGTSFAAPSVASIVALIKALRPALTFTDVYELFKKTATDVSNPELGVPEGFSPYAGWGMVNGADAGCLLCGHMLKHYSWQSSDQEYACACCGKVYIRHEASAPTCEEDGNTLYFYNAVQDAYYSDETCMQEIAYGDWVLPAAEHTWNEGVVTTPATRSENGVKTFTCTTCGATKTEAIAKGEGPEEDPASPKKPISPVRLAGSKVKAGDENNIALWVSLMAGALLLAGGAAIVIRRRKKAGK